LRFVVLDLRHNGGNDPTFRRRSRGILTLADACPTQQTGVGLDLGCDVWEAP
jgi:hypothetical protein